MIYKPKTYWSFSIGITWTALFIVGYFSFTDVPTVFLLPGALIGLLAPFAVSLVLIYGMKNRSAAEDFRKRLLNIRSISGRYWLVIFLLMPAVVLLATLISLLLGGSADQFRLHPDFLAGGWGLFVTLIGIMLAPTFEELGWRSYGMESLKEQRTIFSATMIFGVLWALWHVPLFFIKDYYQQTLIGYGAVHVVNFFVQCLAAAFLMNWVYYKTGRSIIGIILFHAMINITAMILQTEQSTKLIVTLLLIILSAAVYTANREFFHRSAGSDINVQGLQQQEEAPGVRNNR